MIVFKVFGGQESVGVRGMIVFNRPSDSNSTLLSLRFVLFAYFPRRQTKVIEVSSLVGILQFISARLRDVHHDVTRPRPALPALAQTQPSPCPRLRLCCLVFKYFSGTAQISLGFSARRSGLGMSFSAGRGDPAGGRPVMRVY